MEDSLGPYCVCPVSASMGVLILVVMEDSLGLPVWALCVFLHEVLILVVMEDSLGRKNCPVSEKIRLSLNPCCNGR